MNHVLDLDGDWFAMSDEQWGLHWDPIKGERWTPLVVGDVLANVRSNPEYVEAVEWRDWQTCATLDPTVWADPPFVRVADVLPIVKYGEHSTIGRYVVVQAAEGSDRAFVVDNGLGRVPLWPITVVEIDLPGAQPGGWAVRVEPQEGFFWELERWALDVSGPPPSGWPLNEDN